MFRSFWRSTWNINLLTLTTHWRLNMDVLMRMSVFHTSWVISLMVHHFHLLSSVLWIIKILCSLVKQMDLANILHPILHLLLVLCSKFKIFIKTTSSGPSSRICRCLSLSFNTFNNFSCFWIDSTKWIHLTIFWALTLVTDIWISCVHHSLIWWNSLPIWRSYHMLTSRSMVHILRLVDSWSDIQIWMWSHHLHSMTLMSSNISGVLLSVSSSLNQIIMNI